MGWRERSDRNPTQGLPAGAAGLRRWSGPRRANSGNIPFLLRRRRVTFWARREKLVPIIFLLRCFKRYLDNLVHYGKIRLTTTSLNIWYRKDKKNYYSWMRSLSPRKLSIPLQVISAGSLWICYRKWVKKFRFEGKVVHVPGGCSVFRLVRKLRSSHLKMDRMLLLLQSEGFSLLQMGFWPADATHQLDLVAPSWQKLINCDPFHFHQLSLSRQVIPWQSFVCLVRKRLKIQMVTISSQKRHTVIGMVYDPITSNLP